MTVQVPKRLFTVDEFHRMGEARVFGEDDRVELIDGEVMKMTPIGPRHASCVRRLIAILSPLVGDAAIVDVQNPLPLNARAEPQPDVVLLKPRVDFYRQAHPGPSDVLLVIEVADTSAEYDRILKAPQYARAGIAELWVVNLAEALVEVYRQPTGGEYGEHLAVGPGSSLRLPGLGSRQVAVDDVLG
jgi:Uma2 family endonuclease